MLALDQYNPSSNFNHTQIVYKQQLVTSQLTDLRNRTGDLLRLVQVELKDDVAVMSHLRVRCVVESTVLADKVHVSVKLGPAAVFLRLTHNTNGTVTIFSVSTSICSACNRALLLFYAIYRPVFDRLPEPNRAWLLVVYFSR